MLIKRLATALALSALLFGGPSLALAQGGGMPGMNGMSGMDMGHKIVIPPGSEITVADVEFMQGMIAHHAQAVYMTGLAAGHGANPRVLGLDQGRSPSRRSPRSPSCRTGCADSISSCPTRTRGTPSTMAGHARRCADQGARTPRKGVEFDRKFLDYMIQHHSGALKMVEDLFASPGAGQEVDVNVFANDVVTAQTTEIGIMLKLRKAQLP